MSTQDKLSTDIVTTQVLIEEKTCCDPVATAYAAKAYPGALKSKSKNSKESDEQKATKCIYLACKMCGHLEHKCQKKKVDFEAKAAAEKPKELTVKVTTIDTAALQTISTSNRD